MSASTLHAIIAKRDAALEYANMRIDNQMTLLADRDAAIAELVEALRLLISDVQDYAAWQRPVHALENARAVLAKHTKEPS